jgi:hypothetical protein
LGAELAMLRRARAAGRHVSTRYKNEWTALRNGDATAPALRAFAHTAATSLGPLTTSTWDQGTPYNLYCPAAAQGPAGHAWAGCVACAMAQILYFHQYPPAIRYTYTYTDIYGACYGIHSILDIGMDEYIWANMPDTLTASSPAAQIQAVAKLMYHCGVTVDMNYEWFASGSLLDPVPRAFRKYFGYTCSDAIPKSRAYSDEAWYALLAGEILSNRPVFYVMRDKFSGHAVVCDGVRNGRELHVNMGWSGANDAWYDLDNIFGFDRQHQCVVGIAPSNWGGVVNMGTGVFTISTLTAVVSWEPRETRATTFAPGVGDIVIIGSTPTSLTNLSFLRDVNPTPWTLCIGSGSPVKLFTQNNFLKMDKKQTKATFGFVSKYWKLQWAFTIWLDDGLLHIKGVGKNIERLNNDGFKLPPQATPSWASTLLPFALNITGGGISLHAVSNPRINFKTIEGKKTLISIK